MIYINTNAKMIRQHYNISYIDLNLASDRNLASVFASSACGVLRCAGIDIYERVQKDDNPHNWNGGIHSQKPRKGDWLIVADVDDEVSADILEAAHEAGDAGVAKFMEAAM